MKRWLTCFLFVCSTVASAVPAGVRFELDGVPVSQVLRVIYSEALKTDYVLDPAALADARPVSFRYESAKGGIRPFLAKFLDSMGYQVETVGAVDFVRPKPAAVIEHADTDAFVYRVKHRDGSYLVDLLAPLFKGAFTVRRLVQAAPGDKSALSASPPGSVAANIERSSDTLVFNGTSKEIAKLEKILAQVDIPGGQVLVRGVVYEVQTGATDGSAFSLAASVLGGKLGISFGPTTPFDSVLTFKNSTIQAVASALSTDSRFKVMSSPSLRVRSGQQGRFVVGDDVPVLGSLSFPQGAGQAVQSVQYQSSGVIFQITPKVRDVSVDLDLSQTMSSFVNTTTGVNTSPTLTKRQMDTSITVEDGDLIVLGGLTESKDSKGASGLSFLPSFLQATTESASKTEVLLVLQLTKL